MLTGMIVAVPCPRGDLPAWGRPAATADSGPGAGAQAGQAHSDAPGPGPHPRTDQDTPTRCAVRPVREYFPSLSVRVSA